MYWIKDIDVHAGGMMFSSLGENALEISFNIPFSADEPPDVAEVTIYNLSDETIDAIKKAGYITVDAGYREMGNKANILTAEIEDIEVTWSGVDKEVKITASDGAKTWRKKEFKKTYQNGVKASQIMNDLADELEYEVVEITPVDDVVYELGKTVTGLASESLLQLVKDTKSKMYVNKNRIVIREPKDGYKTGFLLKMDTGLVGSPSLNKDESGDKTDLKEGDKEKKKNEETERLWNVTSLLNPRLETDSIIQVESKTLNGTCIVKRGRHTQDFNTEVEVEEL